MSSGVPIGLRRIPWYAHSLAFLALATLVALSISACGAGSTGTTKVPPRPHGIVYYSASSSPALPGQPTVPSQTLVARDASTGAQLWSESPTTDAWTLMASPAAVYVGLIDTESGQSSLESLQALRADNGSLLWQIPPGDTQVVPLALDSSAVCVSVGAHDASGAPTSDTIMALNPTDGSQEWSMPLASGFVANATLDGGTLYMEAVTASPNSAHIEPINLIALDAATGKILWQVAVQDVELEDGGPGEGPVMSTGALYLSEQPGGASAGESSTDTVEAFKTSDGASLWKHNLGGLGSAQSATSTEVVASARQGAGGASFALMALAATNGKQLWSTPLPNGFPASPPLASGDTLYVPIQHLDTGDGVVETLGATDGKQVWSHAVAEGGPALLRLLAVLCWILW